jgi:A/G-specific adenine glycosylase
MLCPLENLCEGYKNATAAELPVRSRPPARRIEEKTAVILLYQRRTALRQRPPGGLLGGLWEFPLLDGHLDKPQLEAYLRETGAAFETVMPLEAVRHVFTHIEWRMRGSIVGCLNQPAGYRWVDRAQLASEITLPSAYKLFYRQLKAREALF